MYCRDCGKELSDGALFCRYCGSKLGINESSSDKTMDSIKADNNSVSFSEKITNSFKTMASDIKCLNYSVLQVISVCMVFIAIICNLITFTYHVNWLMFFGYIFLLYLFLIKEEYNSKIMVITFSVIVGIDVVTNIVLIASGTYYSSEIIAMISDFLILSLYWMQCPALLPSFNEKSFKIVRYVILTLLAILSQFVLLLAPYRYNIFCYLGYACILILFFVLVLTSLIKSYKKTK